MLPVQAWPERIPRRDWLHTLAGYLPESMQPHFGSGCCDHAPNPRGPCKGQHLSLQNRLRPRASPSLLRRMRPLNLISAGNEMVVAAHGGKCSGDLTATAQNQSFGLVGRRNPFLHCRRHTEIRYRVLRRTLKCSAGLCGMPNLVGFTHQTHNAPQFTKVIPKGIITLHFLPLATARS